MRKRELLDLKVQLQSLGLRLEAKEQARLRRGGAGPAEGVFLLFGDMRASVPVLSPYVASSPFQLRRENGFARIYREGKAVTEATIPELPAFYSRMTSRGVPFSHIALLHGVDCLASTVLQGCAHMQRGRGCSFCGINLSFQHNMTLYRKEPSELAQVAQAAKEEGHARHVTLTSGSGFREEGEVTHLARCVREIKRLTSLPIHAQILPLPSQEAFSMLKEAGVDTIGLHIESFDMKVLEKVAPVKATLGLKEFQRAWREAVEVFGRNQVSSFLILGLGEREETVVEGCSQLAQLGVYPFLLPLRPIPNTIMENALPPEPEKMKRLYLKAAEALRKEGLSWRRFKAGCVRCASCSALPDFEEDVEVSCAVVRDQEELAQCLAIRKKVFVQEQGMPEEGERDQRDSQAIHFLASCHGLPIGTVRLYQEDGKTWFGGRLALLKEFRGRGYGKLLIHEATKLAREKGARRFLAYVQRDKVSLFAQCGWKALEGPVEICDIQHMLMEAPLDA